ncbi:MAG: RluA family pseudouridine synthase [Planctomycetota bacterium]|nr:RluA family pseudouridine synthase [Planctomycetota bacterium]MDA1213657.1 RluA family pseudouridine synthase [Planctomycetota bacterium]
MPRHSSNRKSEGKTPRRKSDGQVFHVPAEQNNLTLLSALRVWLPEQSWSVLKKLILNNRVQIHGNISLDAGRRLTTGDVVKVLPHPQAPVPQPRDVVIRYIDKHIVVVEKPAGMTSCRHREERHWPVRRKQLQPTLDEALPIAIAEYYKKPTKGERPSNPRPVSLSLGGMRKPRPESKSSRIRPVHRLDRETSGVMVFARSPAAESKLVEMFRNHDLTRVYRAVIWGHIEEQTIESNLVADRGDGRRGSAKPQAEGQLAITHVRPVETIGEYSIVECQLETGRTHQIRIHLSEQGHPVCGDRVYRFAYESPPIPDHSTAPRVALHAARLKFLHPVTGEELDFEAGWPDDLFNFVQRLRKAASE